MPDPEKQESGQSQTQTDTPPDTGGSWTKQRVEDWRQSLPEDLRGEKVFDAVPDVATLAKNYVHAQKKIGEKGIIKPKDDAPPEEWDAFYEFLGRPTAPEKYKFVKPENLPEGMIYDPNLESSFRDVAFKAGMTEAQAKATYDFYHDMTTKIVTSYNEQQAAAIKTGVEALQKEWGSDYDTRLMRAHNVFKSLADPDIVAHVEQTGLGNHPLFIKFMDRIASERAEDVLVSGDIRPVGNFEQQAKDLMKTDKYLQGDRETINKVSELFRKAHPEKQ